MNYDTVLCVCMCAVLKEKVSESTNRFCEARVAVLGFKCRVIQLSGELEKARLSVSLGVAGIHFWKDGTNLLFSMAF